MNIGKLKKVLENFPDELDVSVISETTKELIPIKDAYLIRIIPNHYFAIVISDTKFIADTTLKLAEEAKKRLQSGELKLS